MDDVIGDTQATFGMISTIRAMLDDAVRELKAGASTTTMQTMTTTETQGDLEWSCSMLQPPSALHSHDDDVRELDQKKTFRDSSRALRVPFKGVPLEL
jgi:hypothetical protein